MLTSAKVLDGIKGSIIIPGDKSISHRSIIIPAISKGDSEINNLLWSEDVIHTINAFKNMGIKIEKNTDKILIQGKGLNSLSPPKKDIYLGNSGTSARLLTGLLSSQNFNSILTGDESLSKRPMGRITEPLELMGAKFENKSNKLPLKILGHDLKNINYRLKLPSAQVKSGLIFAALNTDGKTCITEKMITRDHTEILLDYFDAEIEIENLNDEKLIQVIGKKELKAKNITVPSDLSSAAFFIIAALINEGSHIKLNNINLNPTRSGILDAINLMGGNILITNQKKINGEIVGDIEVKYSNLNGCELNEDYARLMIDEYPILSIAASYANSPSLFKGLNELKVKESDRLELIRYNLDQCGIYCEVDEDNLFIDPRKKNDPRSNIIKTNYDHRIAMAFAIMGTKLGIDLKVTESESINTSFPNFNDLLISAGGNITE